MQTSEGSEEGVRKNRERKVVVDDRGEVVKEACRGIYGSRETWFARKRFGPISSLHSLAPPLRPLPREFIARPFSRQIFMGPTHVLLWPSSIVNARP